MYKVWVVLFCLTAFQPDYNSVASDEDVPRRVAIIDGPPPDQSPISSSKPEASGTPDVVETNPCNTDSSRRISVEDTQPGTGNQTVQVISSESIVQSENEPDGSKTPMSSHDTAGCENTNDEATAVVHSDEEVLDKMEGIYNESATSNDTRKDPDVVSEAPIASRRGRIPLPSSNNNGAPDSNGRIPIIDQMPPGLNDVITTVINENFPTIGNNSDDPAPTPISSYDIKDCYNVTTIDAATADGTGTIHVFSNKCYIQLITDDQKRKSNIKASIPAVFPQFLHTIDAAVYLPTIVELNCTKYGDSSKLFCSGSKLPVKPDRFLVFSGTDYYTYFGDSLTSPDKIEKNRISTTFPEILGTVDAAFTTNNVTLYLISGGQIWGYSTRDYIMEPGYPQLLSTSLRDLPNDTEIHSVFSDFSTGSVYYVTGEKFYKGPSGHMYICNPSKHSVSDFLRLFGV